MKKLILSTLISATLLGGTTTLATAADTTAATTIIAASGAGNSLMTIDAAAFNAFIEKHKKAPYVIETLEQSPIFEKARWQVLEQNGTLIRSQLQLKLVDEDLLTLPLISEFIAGAVAFNGKNFDFGQVVTRPDLSTAKDLPPGISKDTLVITDYLNSNGDMTTVVGIQPVNLVDGNETVDFKGGQITIDSSLNSTAASFGIDLKDFAVTDNGKYQSALRISPIRFQFALDANGNYQGKSAPFTVDIVDTDVDYDFDDSTEQSGQKPAANTAKNTRTNTVNVMVGNGDYRGIYKTVPGLDTPINNGVSRIDKLTVTADNVPIKLNSLNFTGGLYESGKQLTDLKVSFSGNIDAKALKASGLLNKAEIPLTPTSVELGYGLGNIGYDAVNLYIAAANQMKPDQDALFSKAESQALLKSLQNSNATLSVNAKFNALEGDGAAKADVFLNAKGKSQSLEALMATLDQGPEILASLLDGTATVRVNKTLADSTNATMFLMMGGAKPEGNNYVIDAVLTNGTLELNGMPLPLN